LAVESKFMSAVSDNRRAEEITNDDL
jgi:hypothetical protein